MVELVIINRCLIDQQAPPIDGLYLSVLLRSCRMSEFRAVASYVKDGLNHSQIPQSYLSLSDVVGVHLFNKNQRFYCDTAI